MYMVTKNDVTATLSFYFTGNILSIAFFNFAGISVTRELSATTRMVLDSVRTLVIWAVTLALSWQDFQYLQVIIVFNLQFSCMSFHRYE